MRDSSLDEFRETGDESGGSEGASDGDVEEDTDGAEDTGGVVDAERDADAEDDSGAVGERAAPEDDASDDAVDGEDGDAAAVEPAVSSYDWTPSGADCAACGAAVERRWRDDGRMVCADCKAW